MSLKQHREIFENLFVLELANNHWGKLERGLKIIRDHATVVRYNNVRAAIKLQFRDVDAFIHPDYKGDQTMRYIKKTEATKLSHEEFAKMIQEIKNCSCIPMATPFDEASVDLCVQFDLPIIKIASSDSNDWSLLEKIANTRRPVIASTGGTSEKDVDDLVSFFSKRDIPLAINHCISLYPSEDAELNLDQIDYFKRRYPDHVIGLSTHEYHDWSSSMMISYAKGARTWERHVDIDYEGIEVSPYCSVPQQVDQWFRSFHKAVEMCGGVSESRRVISRKETEYLDALVRGTYAKRDLPTGHKISKFTFENDFYLAIPLRKGQLSCRELMGGRELTQPVKAHEPLMIDSIDGPYNENPELRKLILERGL